jgi:hypothetical protein
VAAAFHGLQITVKILYDRPRKELIAIAPAGRVITELRAKVPKTSFEYGFVAANTKPILAAHFLQLVLCLAIAIKILAYRVEHKNIHTVNVPRYLHPRWGR